MIHIASGFGIVNEAEVDVFLELSCFSMIQQMLAIWSLVPLPFLNPACISGVLSSRSVEAELGGFWHYFARMWNECNCADVQAGFRKGRGKRSTNPFFGIGMKTDLFQSCGHCWVFQICWHIECSTFTASSFRIWNNSIGIPPPPLALLVVMLPKTHLTSHSRLSGSRSVITPSWLSGSLGPTILLSILAASSYCLLFLLSPYNFCPLL